ncbi:MAG: FIST N-terminal domain-containing protein [Candidatus Pacebacteria bacterium]|nr:FIST N-terminal domain-containing protein [Candidatus Paceibacterota bacterium]
MNKKIIISVVAAVIVIAGAVVWFASSRPTAFKISLGLKESGALSQSDVIVGYGWSVKPDVKEAVKEAVITASENFKDGPPDYAILLSTAKYDSNELIKELRLLLPNTKIQGGTVMYGMYTKDGYHVGEDGSLAILAVSSPEITIGVGGADVDKLVAAGLSAKEAGKEAGRQAILAALRDAGKEGEKPNIIYMIGSFANEQALIGGIEDVVGKDVPIVGGSAFDEEGIGKWKQFVNGDVYTNGVALTAFFTDLTVAWAFEAGYEKTRYKGIITKCEGPVIYEIDGRPALDVYDEWSGGLVSRVSAGSNEETVTEITKTALLPFAQIMTGANGETHYVPMHPYFWNLKDRSVSTGVNVEVGDEVTVMYGTWEKNLNHCQTTPAKAMNAWGIKKGEAYFAIYNYCLGKMLTIPEEERAKIPLLLNGALGGIPFIGGNTGGEQGFLEGVGNVHAGLDNSIIIFGPRQK